MSYATWAERVAKWSPERYAAHLAAERIRDKERNRSLDYKARKRAEQKSIRIRSRERNQAHVLRHLLSHHCADCGETDPIVLEFDHRDPDEKFKDVSILACGTYGLATLQREIEKCDVVCRNCHIRRTRKMLGWFAREP